MLQTITWTGTAARLLDQTRLPSETAYVDVVDERQMWDAIKRLVVRGAPAIGVAAAFGVYLGIKDATPDQFATRLDAVCEHLKTSRPTAVNLFWAIDRVRDVALRTGTAQAVLDESLRMLEEDNAVCRAIGDHGFKLLQELGGGSGGKAGLDGETPPLNVLTHCNAGGLATVRYGTALSPIYVGAERGARFHVFADETRPLLQGSRITAYELKQNGIPVTVICDNMAATVMRDGKVDAVIVGTDRVAANGDVANKIGTLNVAILAKHFGVPFLVAAPTSSIDLSLATGDQIPIEQRDGREVSEGMGRITAPPDVGIYNPAFDVTPADLVTAIITERGVVRPPYTEGLRAVMT
jgi:methylthioribose-1-phosphate isomerase